MNFSAYLESLEASGNLRRIPSGIHQPGMIDMSSNDYLGLAARTDLREGFLDRAKDALTSSASRLLAGDQDAYTELEAMLSEMYGGRSALTFNSGYHANTGIISALGSIPDTVVIADKLVHASAIDGIVLSRAPFERFRHNNIAHLERLILKHHNASQIIVIAESIYSMDGDRAPLDDLLELKRRHPGIMLIIDEAHAVGAVGPAGAGLCAATDKPELFDVIVGTFGKALASSGAFCITSREVREYLVNHARSLIFSTALPPICARWTTLMLRTMAGMDSERAHLEKLGSRLASAIRALTPDVDISDSHILPLIIGDATATLEASALLAEAGFKVLPIRTPTVPPGTERLRFSLSAALSDDIITRLTTALKASFTPCKA